jgi:hypothetical protein
MRTVVMRWHCGEAYFISMPEKTTVTPAQAGAHAEVPK